MGETHTAAVTSQQRQMMFCILGNQAVISRKRKKKKRKLNIQLQLIFLTSLKLIFHKTWLFNYSHKRKWSMLLQIN